MILIVAVCIFFFVLVTGTMIYFVFRYNKKRNPQATNIHGNTPLEVAWTVIPLILVLVIFFYGWNGFSNMRNVPEDALVVKVTGQMWKWKFEYENGKKSDTLFVPVGKPVRMNIHSNDVNHSFFIPSMRVKEDAVPGRENYLWFKADNIGEYDIACAEYCGLDHWNMYAKLIVDTDENFNAWYNQVEQSEKKTNSGETGNTTNQDSLKNNSGNTDDSTTVTDTTQISDTTKSE